MRCAPPGGKVLLSVLVMLPPAVAVAAKVRRRTQLSSPALHLELNPGTAPPLIGGANFWTAGPRGFNNEKMLNPPLLADLQHLGVTTLLDWTGAPGASRTQPLVDTTTTIRVLGGWQVSAACQATRPIPGCVPSPDTPQCCTMNGARVACCPRADRGDIVLRQSNGTLTYRWQLLWERLDPLVNNSIHLIVVLDNVDYAFVKNASVGKFGQSKAPDDLREYGAFISDLVQRCVDRYGMSTASRFWWRIATEPNTGRGGTGQDVAVPAEAKIKAYVDYYLAVEMAIRQILPAAVVGPGNFASWWQTGMACNSTSGTHANEGLNLIGPMITSILSRNGSIGFLAMSFYGSDAGNNIGSNQSCPRFTGCGYDPHQASVAAQGLEFLRGLSPALRTVPLQVHEYAAMINGYGRGPTYEPGAYGGAWMLASCVQFAANGIDRVFHWGDSEQLTTNGESLYFSNAWVMVAARRLFGTSSAANVSVLIASNGVVDAGRLSSRHPATLAGLQHQLLTTKNDERVGSSSCAATTTASGIGGLLAPKHDKTDINAGAGANANGEKPGIGLLVSVFNQRKDCADETTVRVRFQCPETATCGHRMDAGGAVSLMVLNHTSSVYGQILQDARGHEGWLSYGDGEVYPLAGPHAKMLTPTGMARVVANSQHWLGQQSKLFTPRLAHVSDGVNLNCSGDACTVTLVTEPPSVHALFISLG